MNDFPEVTPALDSSFALPPDTVALYADYEHKRSRLTTFFRFICAIPHLIWLALYGIATFVVVFIAWFALLFTAKYPEGMYNFVVGFQRYATRVNAYTYLVTDKFPPFNGSADEAYAAHFLIGPPKESYSRAKTFFRFILIIPFYIVGYVLTIVFQLVAFVAWLVIVITGKQPKGIQDAMTFCLGFVVRFYSFYLFTPEDWPKFSDEEVTRSLQEKGYQGTIPPTDGAVAAPAAAPAPPAPPAPPAV